MKTGTIYIIRNDVNDKVYIGQTEQEIEQRLKEHKQRVPYRDNKLYVAMREIGKSHFSIYPLERNVAESELNEKEYFYIKKFDSIAKGYNGQSGGGFKRVGRKAIVYGEDGLNSPYFDGTPLFPDFKVFKPSLTQDELDLVPYLVQWINEGETIKEILSINPTIREWLVETTFKSLNGELDLKGEEGFEIVKMETLSVDKINSQFFVDSEYLNLIVKKISVGTDVPLLLKTFVGTVNSTLSFGEQNSIV